MDRIKVDLHDIYNNSKAIDNALLQAFEDAIDKKIKEVEIIPGKGEGICPNEINLAVSLFLLITANLIEDTPISILTRFWADII